MAALRKTMYQPQTIQVVETPDNIISFGDVVHRTRRIIANRYYMALLILAMTISPSFAQSISINIDTDTFITGINQWLPLAVQVIVIGVGIAGAFALATFVGNMFLDALRGRRL